MHIPSGPDGNLWMAEEDTNKIARLSPSTAVMTDVPSESVPSEIVAGDSIPWLATISPG